MKKLLVVLFLAVPVFAADEMRKLDWWVGEWSGPATIRMGPGEPQQVMQSEKVQSKLGGRALLVEGLGKTGDQVVHQALGVVSFNEQTKKYEFHAWTAHDGHVEAWFEAGEKDSASWGFTTPQGAKIRYTINRTEKGEWHEVGEYSPNGTQWMKFFDMTLTKK
ncbi:MAG TPA: DUF1579 family protein [Thermoanaerobaculia bacterium]|nr:DUF1579 family protein [Thermoanaerobaculia bacterium]